MSSFLKYNESSLTPPDGSRRDFDFDAPTGYSPLDGGNVLWLIAGTEVDSGDYTIVYGTDKVTLTLDVSVDPPVVTDLFQVYADSQLTGGGDTPSEDCVVENFTNYSADCFRAAYPQVSVYPGITDSVLDAKIVQASAYCNETKFGVYYNTGMGLLVAHILSLEVDAGLYTANGGGGSAGLGGGFSLGAGGAVNSASAGSVSYSAAIDNSKGGQVDEWLKATGWGQQFLTLRSMITAPGATISQAPFGISGY